MDPRRSSLIAIAIAIAAATAAACGSTTGDDDDVDRADATAPSDARPITCDNAEPAWIGRCELEGTGETCTGVPDEQRVFVELAPDEELKMVIGPQGARMFVFAVRTQGIYPGDPDELASPDNPDVDVRVGWETGFEVARYRGRPVFFPGDPGMYDAAGLFVVIDGTGANVVDDRLIVGAQITDRDGEFRCGTATFIAKGP
jgi:hypothetical protein